MKNNANSAGFRPSPALRRRCIFCGEPPDEKTLEHIIPLWLIKHTGDPKRVVYHGMHFGKVPTEMRPKRFAFDQFRFPACRDCNERWGHLEEIAKSTIQSLELEEPVTERQLSHLLDWFDKIRVGIWLSRQMDGSSIAAIDPKFHVDQRVGASDRLLFISRGGDARALTTIGVGGAIFGFMPSVFALRINSLMFFNASSAGLFGHRLGFPRLRDRKTQIGGKAKYSFHVDPGSHKIRAPVVHQKYPLPAIRIYQPMYPYLRNHPLWQEYFRSEHVLANTLDWSLGEGGIFCETDRDVFRLEVLDRELYRTGYVESGRELSAKVNQVVAAWQRRLSISGVRGDINTPERKRQYETTLAKARKFDELLWKASNIRR